MGILGVSRISSRQTGFWLANLSRRNLLRKNIQEETTEQWKSCVSQPLSSFFYVQRVATRRKKICALKFDIPLN